MSEEIDRREDREDEPDAQERRPMFSGFGIASAALGLLCIAAIVLTYLIWSSHRDQRDELAYQQRVVQTAVEWVSVLVNLNKDNVDASLEELREGTTGELNVKFDRDVASLGEVMKRLQRKASGQISSASWESVHHDPDRQPGTQPPEPVPEGVASRTDFVLVTAASVGQNLGAQPDTQSWNLRIGVSDIDGKLLVSHLEKYG